MASQRCARYTATVSDERSYPSSSRRHASYGGESFGVTAVGAGGVPAASFTAGDRVGSFVDDGVLAVALRATYPCLSMSSSVRADRCRRWNSSVEVGDCSR